MKKTIFIFFIFLFFLVFGAIYYYITLPAINIHSRDFWIFLIFLMGVLTSLYKILNINTANKTILKTGVIVTFVLILIFVIGSILSSPIINAKKYQKLLTVTDREFTEDIKQISFDEIPILDKDTAVRLGSRKMGTLVELVSQFEVSDLYSQINYKGKPTRVSPLNYGNIFKWLSNRKNGLPAYMLIDMATQEVELVKLKDGIKYSFSEPFNRNVKRHLRFNYPTYMFDTINFEIDDSGTPYWICPVKDYTIGLFGGTVISDVILLNAITGELAKYSVDKVPSWVDSVYSAELLISYYNYYGTLKNGFLNSILGQKGCLKTTAGYNYIALEDDVWLYTGVTSVVGDASNVGFVLMNKRTAETRFYSVAGAEEFSAMSSAEGQVQHLGYRATFPLLLNIANEPTYFIALKDNAGLVKSYAMVNIERYQIVAIGDSVASCEQTYIKLLQNNGLIENNETVNNAETLTIKGTIKSIKEIIIDGNTHYFITLQNINELFDILVFENIKILNYEVGSVISFEYEKTNDTYNLVTKILE